MADEKQYITVLNVLSAFAVVMLHANRFWTFSHENWWIVANIVECVFYFAVPVFFMISGANLIDYQERYSTKKFFAKRVHRTVIPFLVWSLAGVAGSFLVGKGLDGGYSLHNVLNQITNCNVISIYWFFIPLFSIYLCIPVLGMIPKEKKKDIFKYMLIAAFSFNFCLPFLGNLIGVSTPIEIPIVSGYLYYTILGYYLDHYPVSNKTKIVIYIFGVAGLLVHIIGTQVLSYQTGAIDKTFKGYLNLPCVVYSTAVYLFFKKKYEKTQCMNTLIHALSGSTFGVYLMHWFVLKMLLKCVEIPAQQIWIWLLLGVAIFFACSAFVWTAKKIPFVRKLF